MGIALPIIQRCLHRQINLVHACTYHNLPCWPSLSVYLRQHMVLASAYYRPLTGIVPSSEQGIPPSALPHFASLHKPPCPHQQHPSTHSANTLRVTSQSHCARLTTHPACPIHRTALHYNPSHPFLYTSTHPISLHHKPTPQVQAKPPAQPLPHYGGIDPPPTLRRDVRVNVPRRVEAARTESDWFGL